MLEDLFQKTPSRKRAAVVHAALGYTGIAVSMVSAIVLVPLYLGAIPERLYGLWLATGGVIAWLGMLDLGIAGVMGQRIAVAYAKRDGASIAAYYTAGMAIQAVSGVVVMLAGLAVAAVLPRLVGATESEVTTLRGCTALAAAGMAATYLFYGQKNTADALLRPFVPSLMYVVGGLLTIGVVVLGLRLGFGLYSLPAATLVGMMCTLTVSGVYVHSLVRCVGRCRLERGALVEMAKFAPAMAVAKAGGALVARIEPTIIAIGIRPESAVAYSVTRRAADLVQMLVDKLYGSVIAGVAHHVAEAESTRSAAMLRRVISVTLSGATVGLAVYQAANAGFVARWVGAERYCGVNVGLAIVAAVLAGSAYNLLAGLLGAIGNLRESAYVAGAEAVVRVLLMAALFPLGIIGLPLASAVSASMAVAYLAWRLHSHYPGVVRVPLRALVSCVALVGLSYLVGERWVAGSWAEFAKGLGVLLVLGGVGVFAITPSGVQGLLMMLRRRRV